MEYPISSYRKLSIDQMQEGTIILDVYGAVVYANNSAYEIFDVADIHRLKNKLSEIRINGIGLINYLRIKRIAIYNEFKFLYIISQNKKEIRIIVSKDCNMLTKLPK